jgi:integrase
MACTVIHGSAPISTGLVWKPAAKRDAMRILDQRLQVYLHGAPKVDSQDNSMRCLVLYEQFVEVRFPKMTKWMQYEYHRYFKAFVPPSVLVDDTVRLRREISKRIQESEYSQNTKRNALKRIRAIFLFGIEQGWLRVNPVHSDMVPDELVHEPEPYTTEDLRTAVDHLSGRNRAFVEFLMASGARAGEAARLTWDAVQDDHVVIDGKRVRSGRQRLRILPYRLCPEIPDVLDQARGASWSGPELVFGITNYQPIARALSDALSGQGRGFHDIRKWRINQWVRLGWPEKVIESLAGHDVRISKKHYRTPYSASELVRFVLDSQPTKAEVSVAEAL